jgi:DNA damage-binding protein 1
MVFRIVVTSDLSTTPSFALHQVAEWNHNFFLSSLVSRGNALMVGDAVSSISLLKLDGTHLETVARDYGSLWPHCLQAWGDKSIIGANVSRRWFDQMYLLTDDAGRPQSLQLHFRRIRVGNSTETRW